VSKFFYIKETLFVVLHTPLTRSRGEGGRALLGSVLKRCEGCDETYKVTPRSLPALFPRVTHRCYKRGSGDRVVAV
jgi:hypothetical protein